VTGLATIVNIDINPTNEQTIKGEVDDSSKVIGDSSLFNRFGSDPDKTKQENGGLLSPILDKSSTSMSVSELNFSNRGLSPIPLDESSTSCFVLSGSEPNLLNRGLSPKFQEATT
jgi:hypothetical protein